MKVRPKQAIFSPRVGPNLVKYKCPTFSAFDDASQEQVNYVTAVR